MSQIWDPSDYQLEALEFGLERPRSGLMLDPGLGKTSITLAMISMCIEAGDIRRVLVVAPLRVAKTVWPVEAKKWADFAHLRVEHLCEMDDSRRIWIMKDPKVHVVVINPESLIKILDFPSFDDYGFDMLVVDESTKFKDTTINRFKKLKTKLHLFKRRVILTGTLAPNGLQDLFGQMYILDEGVSLGKYITHFRNKFMEKIPGDDYSYRVRPGMHEKIYEAVGDKLIRMKSTQKLEMPELIKNFIEFDLPQKHRDKYVQLENTFFVEIAEQPIVAFNAAALGSKLRQFANGFLYHTDEETQKRTTHWVHNEKLDALEELVAEMNGRPLLVAYEFNADRDMILERIEGAIDLGLSRDAGETINAFNRGEIPVLIMHPASGGHGLNLQEACNTVCWYGITWNLEFYIQLIGRVWRRGQKESTVVVHHIVARKTRDEKVMGALRFKQVTQDMLDEALMEKY